MLEDQSGNGVPLNMIGTAIDSVVLDHYERGLPVHQRSMDFIQQVVNPADLESDNGIFTLEWVCKPENQGVIYATPNFPDLDTFAVVIRPDGVLVAGGAGNLRSYTLGWVPFSRDQRGKFNHFAVQHNGANSKIFINGVEVGTYYFVVNYPKGGTFLGSMKEGLPPGGKFSGLMTVIAYYGGVVVPPSELKFINSAPTMSRGMALSLLDKEKLPIESVDGLVLTNVVIDGARVQFVFNTGDKLVVVRPSKLTPGKHIKDVRFSQSGTIEVVFNDNSVVDIGKVNKVGGDSTFEWISGTGYLVGSTPGTRKYIPLEVNAALVRSLQNGADFITIAPSTKSAMSFKSKVRLERLNMGTEAFLPNIAANVWTPVALNRAIVEGIGFNLPSVGKLTLLPGKYHIRGMVSSYHGGSAKARVFDKTANVKLAESDAAFQTGPGSPANCVFNDYIVLGVTTDLEIQYISSSATNGTAPATALNLTQSYSAAINIYKV